MANPEQDGEDRFPSFAWPGGYPLYYLMRDDGVLCPKCANEEEQVHKCAHPRGGRCAQGDDQWCLVTSDVNWENQDLTCDNCYAQVESAYSEE